MIKKQKWRHQGAISCNVDYDIADFFYSLHLKDIEKIRERVTKIPAKLKGNVELITRGDVLLAITDEK